MTAKPELEQALDYYRQQYDEIGSRLLRLQRELTQARRDARRHRTIALVVQRLHECANQQEASTESLGETLIAVLVESLGIDCAGLLSWQSAADQCQLEHGLGLTASFTLPLSASPPARAASLNPETLPLAAQAALQRAGLRNWLWIAAPKAGQALLLGSRQLKKSSDDSTLEEADQVIAAAALKVYLGLREQQQTFQALQAAETNYHTLFESAHEAFVVFDVENEALLDANQRTVDLMGCSLTELRRCPLTDWLVSAERIWKRPWLCALAGRPQRFECEIHTATDQRLWVEINLNRIYAGQQRLLLAVVRDVTQRRQSEQQLRHHAFHDALTQLPNRALILESLADAIQQRQQNSGYLFALLFLDLNRFSIINDSLGHSLGDQLLIAISHRLHRCLRPEDIIARLGGDEFVILLNELRQPDDAVACAERLERALISPFALDCHEIYTSASIGIVLADDRYSEPEAMLRDADIAMYQAKKRDAPYQRYALFDPVMHVRALQIMELEHDLRHAVERQEFVVYYQPIVQFDNGQLKGFEALVRWRHPERGLVPPNDFIPIAEETLLILPIGHLVLAEACRQSVEWAQRYTAAPTISVNLSSRQFTVTDLSGEINQLVRQHGCNPALLALEITESAILEDTEAAQANLRRLHHQGFQLSMDDFGTGYSSLSYLHQYPFDILKIDRSFVQSLGQDVSKTKIINTIITLARTLGMLVVAEGVETWEQAEHLAALGCDFGQGYYYSRPVEATAAEALMNDPHWLRETR
ncbi:MAG: EAL domain-containing protein [Candidatus Competibacteraceae bacterium]|nr:EAL domain-containing protein [Candidatus Competibacteraceae bacterium]MCP5126539.1 EAL domain-containing protein [Gammaproteobacteria bacterium]HRX72057.1 EAL domain-containing protein [Candidatus Competibacteraceae bacterium]